MPTPEEKARKAKLASAKSKVRELLMAGKDAKAEEWAGLHGFPVMEARLGPEYKNPAEPYFVAYEAKLAAMKATPLEIPPAWATDAQGKDASEVEMFISETPEADQKAIFDTLPTVAPPISIKGWPAETPAVIWGFCPNKAMVIIELPDKRKVSMWKGRGNAWRIYDKCRAKLESAEADPIYAPLPVPRKAF